MKDYAILTVLYQETDEHVKMNNMAFGSFPKNIEKYIVINKEIQLPYGKCILLKNDVNCLARAWNIGLKEIFTDYDYAVVSGLDSISPKQSEIDLMVNYLKNNPNCGLVSANNMYADLTHKDTKPIEHGDGSFSFYVISKTCFEAVGDFDENYTPAYFEDNDYIERLYRANYMPKQMLNVYYTHVFQGTVKFGNSIKKNYPVFMQKNLNYFKGKWGKVPNHLPDDITFI